MVFVAESRDKLFLLVNNSLSFIARQFGRESSAGGEVHFNSLVEILIRVKKIMKKQGS